jgi:hypothetical protein
MLFFKVIFEFNFRVMFSEYLLETLNNANDVGLIKLRANPNDNTGYPIHEGSFSSEVNSAIQIYLQRGGETRLFPITS